MRIHCDQCSQALDLPDDKIPQQRFSVACPSCQNKILVDPPGAAPTQPAPAAAAQPAAQPGPAEPGPAQPGPAQPAAAQSGPEPGPSAPHESPVPDVDTGGSQDLTPLRGLDRELLEDAAQAAVIVHYDAHYDARIEQELRRLGMREIHQAPNLEGACDMLQEMEINLLLIRMQSVPAPPCPPLAPIYKLPFDLRRKTFVALLADNVKTLDGQVAFYLQVNCLIQSAEPALAVRLRRAWLHDLRLYRHWQVDD